MDKTPLPRAFERTCTCTSHDHVTCIDFRHERGRVSSTGVSLRCQPSTALITVQEWCVSSVESSTSHAFTVLHFTPARPHFHDTMNGIISVFKLKHTLLVLAATVTITIAIPTSDPSSLSLASKASATTHTGYYWPSYATTTPNPADAKLHPVTEVLAAIFGEATSTQQDFPSTTLAPYQQIPSPVAPPATKPTLPVTTSSSLPQPTSSRHGSFAAQHKELLVAIIIGCIMGLILFAVVYRFVVASSACNCRGRTQHIGQEAKRRTMSLFRLSNESWGIKGPVREEKSVDLRAIEANDMVEIPLHENYFAGRQDVRHHHDIATYAFPVQQSEGYPHRSIPNNKRPSMLSVSAACAMKSRLSRLLSSSTFSHRDTITTQDSESTAHQTLQNTSANMNTSYHGRTKSAPVGGQNRPKSNKSTKSNDSEWDIAHAYGAPRNEKTLSVGAASRLSDVGWH
ncbi:hypothetical protein SERLA73DRAFT_71934 [Serpula lacrymans var. lacrymans S7.3]|uniref:Uncharacterized protein n=2 Tax=Serpula lacrymans var. lacrymans TaxID=341189 RepID=F8PTD6_SERL3|nr:uncharacterized protein SERLADRAFT_436411 [Serpula lacrymans var. lacrymans S7.9]EGO00966.1 hypothetical protein SERLA73DRAFT_71934 [Serpula lacrymans var. lacrymans S7.3]EGO26599.1 hypothetical protein SERLADRAFT_436411 [Serpula lacrymans var. lacrymans S7.9]